jgi:carboxypeptidase PM20D1
VTAAFGRLGDETRALTRSTAVVTMIEAGHAPNALPERAVATVNVRILPGDTVASVAEHIRHAVRDDRVGLAVQQGLEPSPTSPSEGPTWELLEQTIAQLHQHVVVTPYLMLGATDARHFTRISEQVYRFSPFEISAAERSGLHGMNERIRVSTFFDGIRFYRALIERL